MTNEVIQEFSLAQWVASSPDKQRGFREAVHIILTAIGKSADLSSRMVMKGGLLMAIRLRQYPLHPGYRLFDPRKTPAGRRGSIAA